MAFLAAGLGLGNLLGGGNTSKQTYTVNTTNTQTQTFKYLQNQSALLTSTTATGQFFNFVGGDVSNSTISVTQNTSIKQVMNVTIKSDQKTDLISVLTSNLISDVNQMAGQFKSSSPLNTFVNGLTSIFSKTSHTDQATTITNATTSTLTDDHEVNQLFQAAVNNNIVQDQNIQLGNIDRSTLTFDQNIVVDILIKNLISSAINDINNTSQMQASNLKLEQGANSTQLSTSTGEIVASIVSCIVLCICSVLAVFVFMKVQGNKKNIIMQGAREAH
jgi:tetrahydromethanopterin S-methyltransferase subunit F